MTTEEKIKALTELGTKRKQSCYPPYKELSSFHDGKYETDFVSPYTKTACNVDSWILIILQDWSSEKSLSKKFSQETADLGFTPNLPTNKNLRDIIKDVFLLSVNQIFITNAFPFIKPGWMQQSISQPDIDCNFITFCIPQIHIVKPKLVVCCGKAVYLACLNHFRKLETSSVIGSYIKEDNTFYFHQRHTGATATITNGGLSVAKSNWKAMKDTFTREQNGT
jgi:uracil-DNA glycosylase